MSGLKLYNSLTRQKEDFTPIDPDHIRMYACGPTVYNYAHIGNARMAVVCDTLVRMLRAQFPRVTYVSNITDVDDKIIAAAKETGEPIKIITEKYTRIYNEDMATLGVIEPDIQPRATEHIGDMVAQIVDLIDNDKAYAKDGHVLFHVPSYSAYGALSGRSRDEQIAGARVEVAPYKKDPADFVLWKPSNDDEPGWDSPWGYGRPGWHIECSAMSKATLSLPFDIHGGGADLKFPHHENEIAQACGACNSDDPKSFAKYWVHNGFVTVSGEKMSKSLGNIQLVHDLIQHYPGETLRYALLSAHYRQPLNWTRDTIDQAQKNLDRLYRVLKDLSDIDANFDCKSKDTEAALDDDLNTPQAFAVLNQIASDKTLDNSKKKAILLNAGKLLGILQQNPDEWLGYISNNSDIDANKINTLIEERKTARQNKDFARADAIRDELVEMNIEIEDNPDGTTWRVVS
jgi:cysteinyl-tRNA synthetase